MEFVRVGEALLRSQQPLLPFLAPSAYRSSAPRRVSQCFRQHQPSRALSTSCRHHSDMDEFSKMLDETLDQTKKVPGAPIPRTTRYGSNRAQQYQRTSPSDRMASERARGRSSLTDIIDNMAGGNQTSTRSSGGMSDIQQLLDPVATDPNKPTAPLPPPMPSMKLNSTVGRTISVDANRGMDVGRAFRTLEMRCNQNMVKRDHMRQRYHERPGLKRKRLRSERFRKRFKEGFRATIKMVQGLKKQGW